MAASKSLIVESISRFSPLSHVNSPSESVTRTPIAGLHFSARLRMTRVRDLVPDDRVPAAEHRERAQAVEPRSAGVQPRFCAMMPLRRRRAQRAVDARPAARAPSRAAAADRTARAAGEAPDTRAAAGSIAARSGMPQAHASSRRSAGRAARAEPTSRRIPAAGSAWCTRDSSRAIEPRTAPVSRSPSRSM